MKPSAGVTAETTRLVQALLDEAREPLFGLDENGTILEANAAAAALLDRHRSRLRGKPLAAFVAVPDRRRFRSALATAAPPQRLTLEVAFSGVAADSARWLELRRLVTHPPVFVAAVRTHRAAELLADPAAPAAATTTTPAAAAQSLEKILRRLPIAIVRLTRDGNVTFANAPAVRRFGRLDAGKPFPPLESGPLRRQVRRLLSHDSPLSPQLAELEDGTTVRVFGVPPRGAEPALLIVDDVTALVRRTEAQQAFVRNAAHQLRTPLAGIASAVEVLKAGAKDDPEQRDRFLDHIDRQTQRLSRLARALLVLARAQSETQPPRLEFVRLAPVLERIAGELPHASSVDIATSCPPDLAALVEPNLLEEALHALAENAARHTRAGTVTLRASKRDDRLVEIEVADTGDGILPEHLAQIFDPFFRAAPDGTGSGLGLAIARQAVAAMGGELDVTSEPRAGTRFAVRIPSAEVVPT